MIIAIDFDDVMAATFVAMMAEHNLRYGTDLTTYVSRVIVLFAQI